MIITNNRPIELINALDFLRRFSKISCFVQSFLQNLRYLPSSNSLINKLSLGRHLSIDPSKKTTLLILTMLGILWNRLQTTTYSPDRFEELLRVGYRFPKKIIVKGDVSLENMDIHSLPSGLRVTGSLYLINCRNLLSLPSGLVVGRSLQIENCHGLTLLPNDIKVSLTLEITNCSGLRALPNSLRVSYLRLAKLPSLEYLPQRLTVQEGFYLEELPHIANIPEDIRMLRSSETQIVCLINLPQLRSLPSHLNRMYRFVAQNCPLLERLPERLTILQDFVWILDCPSLREIPQIIGSPDTIRIENCNNITNLPENLVFRYSLVLENCRGITTIPESILSPIAHADGSPRIIELINLGLSQETMDDLRNTNRNGVQIHFSNQRGKIEAGFITMEEGLQFWSQEAHKPTITCDLELQEHEKSDLCLFLTRLKNTADYNNENSRPILAHRILDVITSISSDNSLKEKSLFLINQGLISCDDRIILALSQIEQMISIHELEQKDMNEETLMKEGKRYLFLELVRKKAEEHKAKLTWIDEVEIYLAFEIGLAKRFNLPIKTENMIFRGCAQITDEQIQSFGDAIEKECTTEKLHEFLITWSPWIKSEKCRIAKPFEHLPVDTSYKIDPKAVCPFTQEPPEQPIVYDKNLYEYDAFREWFITAGTDPITRKPINWSLVRRVR